MSTVDIPSACALALQSARYFRNGQYPDALAQSTLATETNRILRWRTKALDFTTPLSALPSMAFGSGSRTRWRAVYHASSHARYLWVHYLIQRSYLDGATADPHGKLLLELADGTDVGTAEFHVAGTPSPDGSNAFVYPNNWRTGFVRVSSGGSPVAITPDTDYYLTFSDEDHCRIIAASVYEESQLADTANGYVDGSKVAFSPIYDADRGSLAPLLRTAWKRNAAGLWYWSSDEDATAPTRSSATLANILDQTVTGASTSSTPGAKTDVTYCSTVRRAAAGTNCVPVKWFVYAKMTPAAGTNGHVKLVDTTGFVAQDIAITSTVAAWYSASFSIPNGNNKLDLQLKGDGVNSVVVYGSSLFQYDT
jgi:hypothetical protein